MAGGFSSSVTGANTIPLGGGATATGGSSGTAANDEAGAFLSGSSALSATPTALLTALQGGLGMFGPAPVDSASRHCRKVYIGNLPASASSESIITQFFNQTLQALLPNKPPGEPVVGCYLNMQKRFAFVELRSIEETSFALTLDGLQMDGYALKLRRPQDYNQALATQQLKAELHQKGGKSAIAGALSMTGLHGGAGFAGSTAPAIANAAAALGTSAAMLALPAPGTADFDAARGIVSTSVDDGPNKVFIGGLPHSMTEQDVKELLQSFGPLRAFHLVKDREQDRSKGFAFCEWRNPEVTDVACAALNGMRIGDRFLNVRRAVAHAQHHQALLMGALGIGDPSMNAATAAAVAASSAAMPAAAIMAPPLPPGASPSAAAAALLAQGIPSLANMVVMDGKGSPLAITDLLSDSPDVLNAMSRMDVTPPLSLPAIATTCSCVLVQGPRCLAFRGLIPLSAAHDVAEVQRITDVVKAEVSKVAKPRSAVFHHSGGGQVVVELGTTEEAVSVFHIFNDQIIDGRRAICALVELLPQQKAASWGRIQKEVEFLAKMTHEARALYLQRDAEVKSQLRNRREERLRQIALRAAAAAAESVAVSAAKVEESSPPKVEIKSEDNALKDLTQIKTEEAGDKEKTAPPCVVTS